MVALLKPREHRHYPMGPIEHDIPLKLYEPPAKQVPWFVDLVLAAGFFGVVFVDLFAWMQFIALGVK